jgi:hypothetical protein
MTDPILAKAFAVADATEQAGLIDAMARELFVVCGGRFARHSALAGYEPQCCEISRKLTKDGVQFIKDLHAFIELREEAME